MNIKMYKGKLYEFIDDLQVDNKTYLLLKEYRGVDFKLIPESEYKNLEETKEAENFISRLEEIDRQLKKYNKIIQNAKKQREIQGRLLDQLLDIQENLRQEFDTYEKWLFQLEEE